MTTYPDLKNEPELLKIKTRVDEIKNLKYPTEYKSLNKKKVLLIISEILIGSGSAISTSTMS